MWQAERDDAEKFARMKAEDDAAREMMIAEAKGCL
jgi:hypothetical protein